MTPAVAMPSDDRYPPPVSGGFGTAGDGRGRVDGFVYFLTAHDELRKLWLVIAVDVGGPAVVMGRWTTQEAAEKDAQRWWELEYEATT